MAYGYRANKLARRLAKHPLRENIVFISKPTKSETGPPKAAGFGLSAPKDQGVLQGSDVSRADDFVVVVVLKPKALSVVRV